MLLKSAHTLAAAHCASRLPRAANTQLALPSLVRSSGATSSREYAPSCPLRLPRGRNVVAMASASTAKPAPTIKIDNTTDAFATILHVDLPMAGAATSELLETVKALKSLGLNIRRAKYTTQGGSTAKTFYITEAETSEKIIKSARLEEIRMTVLQSLGQAFPEVKSSFSKPAVADAEAAKSGPASRWTKTNIEVTEASNGSCSVLKISTADRPGLLVDIVKVLKDVNLNVVSAEVDTVGATAKDEFFITYHGEPLAAPMVTLVTNTLAYYLSLNDVAREESY